MPLSFFTGCGSSYQILMNSCTIYNGFHHEQLCTTVGILLHLFMPLKKYLCFDE
jgi:hypothetical protein